MKLLVIAALLASTCQVGPFKDPPPPDPGWPIGDSPLAAAGAPSSCASAVETSKRLGCPFEADDAGAWCATHTAKEVACMSAATSCLAQRRCTEAAK